MIKQVGHLKKKVIGISGEQGEQPLTYGDLNGRSLHFPDNNVYPFLEAIYFVAKTAYENAMKSAKPHQFAIESCPSEESWLRILERIKSESPSFGDSLLYHACKE
jgi:hypothetical protein